MAEYVVDAGSLVNFIGAVTPRLLIRQFSRPLSVPVFAAVRNAIFVNVIEQLVVEHALYALRVGYFDFSQLRDFIYENKTFYFISC